ncbi:MAG: hypothetical protein JXR96_19075 [Deltaproteobacteria bacterium]|nr:hypothetical protein [Deltaproteobacteria bacterium]
MLELKLKGWIVVLLIAGAGAARAAPEQKAESSATMPLPELLELYRQVDRAEKVAPARAPLAATVDKIVLSGRLLAKAVELSAHFEVTVLDEDRWVAVPLLREDPAVHLSEIPEIDGAVLSTRRGLELFTRRAGNYRFDLSFLIEASEQKGEHRASIRIAPATLAVLYLQYDEGLFRLAEAGARKGAEGTVFFPAEGEFSLRWEPTAAMAERKAPEREARPPVESVIPSAHASVVATLEGRRITRMLYKLRFEGSKQLELGIPAGQRVAKIFLNSAAIPFEIEAGKVRLEVAPERAGDESARLELVMESDAGGFLLSGGLHFDFPAVSWGVNELFVELHLPQVFNYRWTGGSLAPASGAEGVDYFHRIPTPGKSMCFHQDLIGAAPDLDVAYTVDLQGHYYTGSAVEALRARPAAAQGAEWIAR